MYFTWQYHSTAWVPTGGSLTPWMPYTDLVLPDQYPSPTDETYSLLIFWEECLDKDNDVCMPGHKKKAFCGVIYCSNRPWQQLDSMVINITTLPRRELGIPTHWTCSKEQMVTLSPQAVIFLSRLQWHSCLLRGYRTIRESKARRWGLPHRLWSALGGALAHKGTRRT